MMVARIGDSSEAVVVGSDAKPEMARLDDNNALRSNGLGANFTPTNLPLSLIGDDKGDSVMSTPNLPCETPSRSIRASPKLVFMSDRKSVPTEIKGLQERTIKRRRDFLARMHELDCHTAKLMSECAEERMNLDLATSDTFERTVIRPLVTSVERLAITREGSTNRLLEIPTLERRISLLDTQMTRHINVTMSDAKIDMLDSLQDDLQRNLKAEFRTENTTFNKVEGGIVQRFESAAGTITRNIHSEGASRRSAIAALQHKLENTIPKPFERAETWLSQIAHLRAQLHEERVRRQDADKAICEEIERKTGSLKRAMIAMADDGDNLS